MHAHLGISDAEFDEMARLLSQTLDEHSFEPADREAVMHEIEARRAFIVGRAAA
jgi:hemoglobin